MGKSGPLGDACNEAENGECLAGIKVRNGVSLDDEGLSMGPPPRNFREIVGNPCVSKMASICYLVTAKNCPNLG